MFLFWKKKKNTKNDEPKEKSFEDSKTAQNSIQAREYLDDISFIQEMKHSNAGLWQQYDFLLAAKGYGWETMMDWAQYMADGDLKPIHTLTCAMMLSGGEKEFIEQYRACGERIADIPDILHEEWGVLAVGGASKALNGAPVKIVWLNQTRVLRIFTLVNEDRQMQRYAETVIRRSFGTEEAMKLAKPIRETPSHEETK